MLRGRWMQAIALMLILSAMVLGLNLLEDRYRSAFHIPLISGQWEYNLTVPSLIITGVFSVLTILFTQPLAIGQSEWYWKVSGGDEVHVGDVFGWFGSLRLYGKSLWLWLNLFVRYLLWSVAICALPYACILTSVYYFLPRRSETPYLMAAAFLLVFGCLLLLVAVFVLLYVAMRYFLAPYLLVEDNTRRVGAIVRDSVRFSKTYRWDIVKFVLSFIPWFISCYFILPMLYVWPYFFSSSAVLARHIILTARSQSEETTPPPAAG